MDADNIGVEGRELNKGSFRVSTFNRTTRKGGGLTIVYKQDRIIKKESEGNHNTFIPDQLVENDNVLILGDFNIHINDQTNEDSGIFTDIMEALGLSQHVEHPTHRIGNTLDLIFTETNGNTQLDSIREGPFFPDHSAVTLKLWFPRDDIRRSKIMY